MTRQLASLIGWVFAGVILFLWLVKGAIVANVLTEKMGVPVEIGWIHLGIEESTMQRFSIQNPPHYRGDYALETKRTAVDYSLKTLFGKNSVIDSITLSDSVLYIEFSGEQNTSNNWAELLQKVPKAPHHNVMVKKFILNNLTVRIGGRGDTGETVRQFDQIEFDDISSQNGFPTRQLVAKLFGMTGAKEFIEGIVDPLELFEVIF